MAARKKALNITDDWRARIQTSMLINRLTDFVVGKVEMTPHQVTAALGLLRKTAPDLAAVAHTGEVTHRYVARAPALAESTDEWQKQHAPPPTMQ